MDETDGDEDEEGREGEKEVLGKRECSELGSH